MYSYNLHHVYKHIDASSYMPQGKHIDASSYMPQGKHIDASSYMPQGKRSIDEVQ